MKTMPKMTRATWLKLYQRDQKFFNKEGFTLKIAEQLNAEPKIQQIPLDAYYLFLYAKRIPDSGTYLEIGSANGGSLLCAFLASQLVGRKIHFIAIDPLLDWPIDDFRKNTQNIPCLKLLRLPSDQAVDKIDDNSIDLIFVDGNHEKEQVKRDIENYRPKLKIGGIFLGHDYGKKLRCVMEAVNVMFNAREFTVFKNSKIWMTRKVKNAKWRPIVE